MKLLGSLGMVFSAAAILTVPAFGQNAISAKAGMINVADGDVYVGDRLHTPTRNEVMSVPKGEVLRTTEGRAEVLLTPGAWVRVGEFSSFRLVNNDLSDVVLDIMTGGALVEVTELLEGNAIRVRVGDAIATLKKAGIYRIDAEPEQKFKVYEGVALVKTDDREYELKGSKELVASAAGWSAMKFDSKETDPLYRWAMRRSEYIAMANLSSARTANFGSSGGANMMGRWMYNSWFGTYTYVPWSGMFYSPFGYAFFSPYTVYYAYVPRPIYSQPGYGGGGGAAVSSWGAGPSSSGGYMGTARSGGAPVSSGGGGAVMSSGGGGTSSFGGAANSGGGGVGGGASVGSSGGGSSRGGRP